MKKILLILLIGITYAFANVGKITAIKGEVYIVRDSKQIVAKSGSILELKDQVQTKAKAKALVLFKDNTSITVGNNSLLSVNEFVMDLKVPEKSKTNFGFGKGVFRTITGRIGKINPKGFKIKTKSASIGIRGTTLDTSVKILPNGTQQVDVAFLKGHGIITSDATGVETPVATGQHASMQQDGKTEVKRGPLEESNKMDKEEKELKEAKAKNEEKATEKGKEEKKAPLKKEKKVADDEPTGGPDDNGPNNVPPRDGPPVVPNIPPYDDDIKNATNTSPTLSLDSSSLTLEEDSYTTISYTVYDKEDGTNLTTVVSASNGAVTIGSDGTLTYTPTASFSGYDTITITVTDSKGASTTQTISVTVTNIIVNPISDIPIGDLDLDTITKQSMCPDSQNCDHYSTYLDYGYVLDSISNKIGAYYNGNVTPTDVIASYISQNQTGNYSGGIAAFVDGVTSSGTINLDMNFGTQNFTGNINITEGNWKAAINSGAITSHGFDSTDISSATGSSISNITGDISGKFYGPNANAVGGSLNLNSGSSSVSGAFGATGQID